MQENNDVVIFSPYPKKTWTYTGGVKNNMSKIVAEIQLLTVEMMNQSFSSLYIFASSPFVLADTRVAKRLEKSSETRQYVFKKTKQNGI